MVIQFRSDCKYAVLEEPSTLKVLSYSDFLSYTKDVQFNLDSPMVIRDGEMIFKGNRLNEKTIWVYPIAPTRFDNNYIVFYKVEDNFSFFYADNEMDIPSDDNVLVTRI